MLLTFCVLETRQGADHHSRRGDICPVPLIAMGLKTSLEREFFDIFTDGNSHIQRNFQLC